jgi:hypothetical protein
VTDYLSIPATVPLPGPGPKVDLPDCTSPDQILDSKDQELQKVPVPEWGVSVYLRALPADEGIQLSELMEALPKERKSEAMQLLLGACLVTAEGKRLFSTEEQCKQLRTRSHKVLTRLQEAALALQGWKVEATGKNA